MSGHWYISCGELSAEIHARKLVAAMRHRDPGARFSGMGSASLAQEGVELVVDSSELRVMGLVEILGKLGHLRRTLAACVDHIRMTQPRAVICVDYPGFHSRLAARIKKELPSIPVIQYISPKFWAWNYRRVKKMRRVYDLVLCIFPFEKELLDREGIPAAFVGNPLLDELDLSLDGAPLRRELGVNPDTPLVGIFPGSRPSEIRRHMPIITGTIDRVREEAPQTAFALALCEGMTREDLEQAAPLGTGARVLEGRAHELMAASDIVLAKSGTTTLEVALYGKPMVIFYQLSTITITLWNMLRHIRHAGLPNIIACDFAPDRDARESIVPELIGGKATPEACATHLLDFLQHPALREATGAKLKGLVDQLGGAGASLRAADAILRHTAHT